MSEDFKTVFFEEAVEHLQSIEDELLILDGDRENSDALDAIFRAAHSIKGSAGMFGFSTLSAFTHHLETLLDLVRKGEAELTDDRIEIVLSGVDEIRAIVDQLQEGDDNPPADAKLTATLEQENRAVKSAQPAQGAVADQVREDDAFGLFDEEPEDETFGLFDQDTDDDSFGLFEADEEESGAPGAESSSGNAYHEYFDEMLREAPDSVAEQSSDSHDDRGADDAAEEDDPDGRFGWLNRPEQVPANAGRAVSDKSSVEKMSPPEKATGRSDKSSGSLRVSLEKVDQLVNQISELVITQAMLRETAASLDVTENEQHLASLETLERTARELQESVLSIRLLPVKFLFSRFPRVVRDLSRKLGKEVELVLLGEQTELDKSLIEKLSDPLTHLIRNSIDHGVEQPAEREAAGKPAKGQVLMAAAHEGGDIVISISDDGAGINRSKVMEKARSSGIDVSDDWTDEQVFNLIFEAGFSTAAEVTDVSGRGVGMDVVKRNIRDLNGRIEVKSSPGQGSVFTVRLPLTLAITDGMVILCGGQKLVIPISNVVESLQLGPDDLHRLQGKGTVIRRHGDFVPIYSLASLLGYEQDPEADGKQPKLAIIVESEGQQVGLLVDDLVGQQQIVIKNLEANYRKVAGFSGATVMGDGSVAFILDIGYFVAHSGPETLTSAVNNPTE